MKRLFEERRRFGQHVGPRRRIAQLMVEAGIDDQRALLARLSSAASIACDSLMSTFMSLVPLNIKTGALKALTWRSGEPDSTISVLHPISSTARPEFT